MLKTIEALREKFAEKDDLNYWLTCLIIKNCIMRYFLKLFTVAPESPLLLPFVKLTAKALQM